MTIERIVPIRHEKKKFIVEGKPITGQPDAVEIRIDLQDRVNSLQWPQECANCGKPAQKTDTLIESSSFSGIGAVAVSVTRIPYCEVCYPKIKKAQNIYFLQLITTFVIGVVLSFLLIKWQGESGSSFIACGATIAISFAIGYGLSWLLLKYPAQALLKDKYAEPVKAGLMEETKADGNKIISLALTIPNEDYATRFAELNGVQ